MTIDDYYTQASDAGTYHLSESMDGPAFCGYDFDGRGSLVLDTGVGEDAVCQTCAARVR